MISSEIAQPDNVALREALSSYFGPLTDAECADIAAQCVWVEYGGGEIVFRQGDPGNALYILVSGRLRAMTEGGKPLGDIAAGETVGEMAILSDDVRSATVLAARDSVVIRIPAEPMQQLFLRYPRLLLKTSRLIIERARRLPHLDRRDDHVTNIALLPLADQIDLRALAAQMRTALQPHGRVLVLDADNLEQLSEIPGAAHANKDNPLLYRRVTAWLDTQEAAHDYVLYIAARRQDAWTQRCLRQADRIVAIAAAGDNATPGPLERELIEPVAGRFLSNILLALMHAPETVTPHGTQAWLAARSWVHEVVHVRAGDAAHIARLARIASGNAVGLVIGSGGARGLAAVGVYRALREAGIAIDRVGGCSIGAVMAAGIAMDWDADKLGTTTATAFGSNPTSLGDMSLLPILALFRGNRLARLLHGTFPGGMHIEDLWINYFCISSDMATSQEVVHTRGPLARAIKASAALPAIFPAVRIGDGLHVDGAFMNALPIDIMGRTGADKVVAIDFTIHRVPKFAFEEFPSTKAYLYDKFFKARKQRRYRIPTLVSSVIQSSLLASAAKDARLREEADLLFNPDVRNFDLMEWKSHRKLLELGYSHAQQVLAASPFAHRAKKQREEI